MAQNFFPLSKPKSLSTTFHNRYIAQANSKLNSSASRKTDLLDEIVFPAMANLVYFCERIASSPELQEVFELDLKDLFDIRERNANGMIDLYIDPRIFPSISLSSNNLVRLISAILLVNEYSKLKTNPMEDFRLVIINQLQNIVAAILLS